MKYKDYLKTKDWELKRKATYKKARYQCQLCHRGNIRLNAHHIYYADWKHASVAKDLMCLCTICHSRIHELMDKKLLLDWPSYRNKRKKATKKQYKKYLRKNFKKEIPYTHPEDNTLNQEMWSHLNSIHDEANGTGRSILYGRPL